jgi:hypothetical protein
MTSFRTLGRLSAADWARLGEAFVLLVCVRAGLRLLSFAELNRRLDVWARTSTVPADSRVRIAWAVGAVTRRLPGTKCLAEALTACAMLRRHGHDATLCIGARHAAAPTLVAHAWVECDGEVVVGNVAEIEDYAVLT